MINQVFRLIKPRIIQANYQDIDINCNDVIVHPTYLSICAADQRYYMGKRSEQSLRQKLPMALIHEAAGEVVYDKNGLFCPGDKVVMIPNTPIEKSPYASENYLFSSKFRASSLDGFMQEYVRMRPDRLVKYNNVDSSVASLTELMSVAFHSIETFLRVSHEKREHIGVWGDGNVAYLVSLLLRKLSPKSKITIIGVDPYKLDFFSFADRIIMFNDMPNDFSVDHAFECVGGKNSEDAISQIIQRINPEGTLMLMGVSENKVLIETRMVLEKGIRLIGRSRSGFNDFAQSIGFMESDPELVDQVKKILRKTIKVSNIKDMSTAFEEDSRAPFKTVMEWNI